MSTLSRVPVLGAIVLLSTASPAQPAPRMASGDQGNYYPPLILQRSGVVDSDDRGFTKGRDYISIQLVDWYVNQQSNWADDKSVIGTVTVDFGPEKFSFVLGQYLLKHGATTIPQFNDPLVRTHPYVTAPIITVFAKTVDKKTPWGAFAESLKTATFSLANTYIQTAIVGTSGPLLLGPAQTAVSGLQTALNSQPNEKPIFDLSGFSGGIQSEQLSHPVTYILFHRGFVDPTQFQITLGSGATPYPMLGNQPLADGAWMLFRVTRSQVFDGDRPWTSEVTGVTDSLAEAFRAWELSSTNKVEATNALMLTPERGSKSAADRISNLRILINGDTCLTRLDQRFNVARLDAITKIANDALAMDKASDYRTRVNKLEHDLEVSGYPSDPELQAFFEDHPQSGTNISFLVDLSTPVPIMAAQNTYRIVAQKRKLREIHIP